MKTISTIDLNRKTDDRYAILRGEKHFLGLLVNDPALHLRRVFRVTEKCSEIKIPQEISW